jgi:DNA-binding LacI/PurR family transcriptional regulator
MGCTIKDIAKIAGVSHTTVSRALNNSSLISDKTKAKIKKIADEYGYVIDNIAKGLVLHKTFNIGVFFSTRDIGLTSNFFHEIIIGIQSVIKDEYNLIIRWIEDYDDNYSSVHDKKFDGVIIVSQSKNDDSFLSYIKKIKMPAVIINRNSSDLNLDSFFTNEKEIVKNAIELFIKNGHRKIAVIKGKNSAISTEYRLNGYLDALKRNHINLCEEYIISGKYDIESGYAGMRSILKLADLPTAIFCFNDNMAIGAMRLLHERNYNVPKDFSVIGFDNTEYSKYTIPALTTIDRPMGTIMIRGINRLLFKIENKKQDLNLVAECIKSTLITGSSVLKI